MRTSIRDRSVLGAISLSDLTSYLTSRGWRERARAGRWATIWSAREDQGGPEMLLPTEEDVADYVQAMADALAVLERAEDRSQLEILVDVRTSNADVLRIPLSHGDAADATIRLHDGLRGLEFARDLVTAAACATHYPRKRFAGRRADEVEEYLRQVRLGQTEQGSYVVTVVSQVPSLPPQAEMEFDGDPEINDPFARRTTKMLARSLSALSAAAEAAMTEGVECSFERAVPKGVSADLCEAVLGLDAVGGHRGFKIGFKWAPTRPAPSDVCQSFEIPDSLMDRITEGRHFLEAEAPPRGEWVEGLVESLSRPEQADTGKVAVNAWFPEESGFHKVHIDLDPGMYHEALMAHDSAKRIRCYGDLVREGPRTIVLKRPSGLRVLL